MNLNDDPPVKEGYVRIYDDHTGRNYQDILESDLKDDGSVEWELMKILQEEITKEFDKIDMARIRNEIK